MIPMPAKGLVAFAILCWALLGVARAADPLPANTRLVAASTAATTAYGTTGGKPLQFTIATTQDLVVTLKFFDPIGVGYGSPVSAGAVVTQGGAIAASALLAAPATSATAALSAASGDYTLYVFGVPDAGTGRSLFSVCVAPKANPSNCISTASLSGIISAQSTANDPTVSTLSRSLVVTSPGSYTFNFADLQFPVALNSAPSLALFLGIGPVPGQTTPGITAGSSLTLPVGTYTLLAIAQADQTIKSGLYGITITGPAGTTPLLDTAVPVGLTPAATACPNPTSQSVTLKVTDYAFPAALTSASALLTAGGTALGTASAAGGAMSFSAPAAPNATPLYLWTYGSAVAPTPGTFSVDVAGATDLCMAAQGIQPPGTNSDYAFAFLTPSLTAGAYQATGADLQFPSQLTGLSFAVAQGGLILKQSPSAASLNITAAAGNVVLLVSAQTPASGGASGNGLFDVNLQTIGASASLVYDKTQSVSSSKALFDDQTLILGVSGSFDASLTDLKFPAQFQDLALVVSRGSEVLGKIYGGGVFSFAATPGSYQLTFVATPSADQQFGLYAVSVVSSPPVVTLTSNVSTAATGTPVTLTWGATNATTCTASGGSWTGSKATSSSSTEAVALTATTTYTLTCTGDGGTKAQSVTVTATAAPASSHGGGGALGLGFLAFGSALLGVRLTRNGRKTAVPNARPF